MARILTATLVLLMALVVLDCSGSSGEPASEQPAAAVVPVGVADLQVSSPNFQELKRPRKRIPKENTCFAENISPPLDWSGVPEGTKSLALIAEEPEERISSAKQATYNAAASGDAVHWVLYNIPPTAAGLPEGVPTTTDVLPDGTVQGVNDLGLVGYTGPCPPSSVVQYYAGQYLVPGGSTTSDAPRDYYFRLYALDAMLELAPGATAAELATATEGHILGYGETMGKFQAPRQQGWYRDDTETPVANTPTPTP